MQTIIVCAFALAAAQGQGQIGAGPQTSSTTVAGVLATSSTSTPGVVATSSSTLAAGVVATSSTTLAAGLVATTSSTTLAAGVAATSSTTLAAGVAATSSTTLAAGVAATTSSTTVVGAVAAASSVLSSSSSSSSAAASSSGPIADMGPWTDQSYLEGTWQSKSGMVVTGPDFYDPVHELLIDPGLPGWSYSFTSDGYWEEAIYQITSDGSNPTCPTAVLIFQHGTYEILSNGSLSLTPFADDGRQLLSDPCHQGSESEYTRYNQTEFYKQWYVEIDNYHGRYKLQLYKFDGGLMPPLYLAYKPPQMLPTETMNPTSNSSHGASTTAARARIRRSLENARNLKKRGAGAEIRQKPHFDWLWYGGVSLMAGGGLAFAVLT